MTLLISSTNAISNDVVSLEKGKPAPFTGILFSESKAKEVRNELLDKDILTVENKALKKELNITEKIVSLREEEVNLYRKQNERLLKLDKNNEVMKYVWFGLGVLVTGAAVYGAGTLSR